MGTVRERASAGVCGPEADGVQWVRGAAGDPRGAPLHAGLAPQAAVHVEGGGHAHRGRRHDRGRGEAELHHGVAGEAGGRRRQRQLHEQPGGVVVDAPASVVVVVRRRPGEPGARRGPDARGAVAALHIHHR